MSPHLEQEPVGPADEAPAPAPAVLIVPYRPGKSVAGRLGPPLVIMLLGLALLAYRARSADWRGLSALFEAPPRPTVVAPPQLEAPAVPAVAAAEEPAPVAKVEAEAKAEPEPEKPQAAPPAVVATPPDAPKDKVEPADPIDDIRREAAKTRERIAELERQKELASEKLDETAREREQADRLARLARRNNARLGRAIPPAEFEKRLREQHEQLARLMDEMQQRQMAWLARAQRGLPDPPPGFVVPPGYPKLLPMPDFGPLLGPDGGVPRFREFRGPGGMRGFELHWNGRPALPGDRDKADVPPPPVPAFPGNARID